MGNFEQSVISTILYYRLLDRPLTIVELFKFLNKGSLDPLPFGQFALEIKNNKTLAFFIKEFQGFYFLKEEEACQSLSDQRQKKIKISQLKWREVRKISKIMQFLPFLEMIGVTGSLDLDNARKESDFDFLIVLKPGRLWLGRVIITLALGMLGRRRHHEKTRDRVCLNCYLTGSSLAIKPWAKPHDIYSAQEYARVILIWQKIDGLFTQFQRANSWIKEFLSVYPWPGQINLKRVKTSYASSLIKWVPEFILSGFLGNWLESALKKWQIKRVKNKTKNEDPSDQIYFSDQCLIFHPQSKSFNFLAQYRAKIERLLAV